MMQETRILHIRYPWFFVGLLEHAINLLRILTAFDHLSAALCPGVPDYNY